MEVNGGRGAETVATFGDSVFRRGVWGQDGTMLIATDVIYRVPATGGEAKAVTRLDLAVGEIAHSAPWFLPDGRHFLFKTTTAHPQNRAIYVGSLDPDDARIRLLDASRAVYSNQGSYSSHDRGRSMRARSMLIAWSSQARPF
jgi:hypothetical protein